MNRIIIWLIPYTIALLLLAAIFAAFYLIYAVLFTGAPSMPLTSSPRTHTTTFETLTVRDHRPLHHHPKQLRQTRHRHPQRRDDRERRYQDQRRRNTKRHGHIVVCAEGMEEDGLDFRGWTEKMDCVDMKYRKKGRRAGLCRVEMFLGCID